MKKVMGNGRTSVPGAPVPSASDAEPPSAGWRAVADQLADALEAVQDGWLHLTAAEGKNCPAPIREVAAEKFCAAIDKRRAALTAYEVARRDAPQDTPPAASIEDAGRADAREVPT